MFLAGTLSRYLQEEIVQFAYATNQTSLYNINGYLKVAPDQKVLTNEGYIEAQDLTYNEILLNVYLREWGRSTK